MRYEVTVLVKRQFIVYADEPEVAQQKVEQHVRSQGSLLSFTVEDIRELGPIEGEAKNPEVDGVQPREART